MNGVFMDTSAVVALFNRKDDNHHIAKELFQEIIRRRIKLYITDYILDESITTVLSRVGHKVAVQTGAFLMKTDIIKIIWLSTELKLRVWEYFKRHKDKNYSFTDCTSFVLMKEMRLRHYIAFDEHFRQAGVEKFR